MRICKMITIGGPCALILTEILSTTFFFKKFMEMSLENLYVDIRTLSVKDWSLFLSKR